jgi:hypothetical protein
MEPKDASVNSFWQYFGITITAGGVYLIKILFEAISKKIKSKKKSKESDSSKSNLNRLKKEDLSGVQFNEINLIPESSYIRQVEITSRIELVMEDSLRISNPNEIYDAIINHIEFAKELNLESVKIEFPHHSFLNSSAINSIIRICQYIRDHNGIRLVLIMSPLSESCKKLHDQLIKLISQWESGRIEIYYKAIKDKLNYEDYKKHGK